MGIALKSRTKTINSSPISSEEESDPDGQILATPKFPKGKYLILIVSFICYYLFSMYFVLHITITTYELLSSRIWQQCSR